MFSGKASARFHKAIFNFTFLAWCNGPGEMFGANSRHAKLDRLQRYVERVLSRLDLRNLFANFKSSQ